MINNRALVYINKEYLIYKPFVSRIEKLLNLNKKEGFKLKLKDLNNLKVNLNKKTLSVIVEGEEVYIKLFKFPNKSKYKIYEMINNELEYKFKNIDNIMFTYKILGSTKKEIDVLVFCMNSSRLDVLKKLLDKHVDIRAVYPLQVCALNSCKKTIEENKYIFTFLYENNLYFLACVNNNLMCNSVVENFKTCELKDEINRFTNKCISSGIDSQINKIYFLNVPYKEIEEYIPKKFKSEDLGEFDINEIGVF